MAELKEMLNNFVAVLKDLFNVLKNFIADITSINPMPWEGDEWATKAE